jgi:hypothetical protein
MAWTRPQPTAGPFCTPTPPRGYGLYADVRGGTGVHATSNGNVGVYGESDSAAGVYGNSASASGVTGVSSTRNGGWFTSTSGGAQLHLDPADGP